jgi:hypothetical protein
MDSGLAPSARPGMTKKVGRNDMRLGTVGRGTATAVLALALIGVGSMAGHAQSPAEFYKSRNVELYIGYSVGGAYDLYARVLARHIGRHIPGNPTIIAKNMEGAGSLRLANWLYNVGAKDGTVLGVIGRGTGFDPLLGTKAKIVSGYPGGNDITLAMERGEVKGRCGWSWSSVVATHKRWIDDKTITVLVQLSLAKHPDLPDIPLVMDFAKTDEQKLIFKLIFARQVMGRPFVAPPGLPKDRADALRKAFDDTMKDPDFLADAAKTQLEITPVTGVEVEKLVTELYQTPKAVADKAADFIRSK